MQLLLMNAYLENASKEMIQTHMIQKALQNDYMLHTISFSTSETTLFRHVF